MLAASAFAKAYAERREEVLERRHVAYYAAKRKSQKNVRELPRQPRRGRTVR